MLGYSHAVSGAVGWLVIAPPVSHMLNAPLNIGALAAGTLACAGAALIPDLDHPQATIAYTFGPISHGVAKMTRVIFGGHRMGTHSLLFALGLGAVCQILVAPGWLWPAWIIMFLLSAFAIRGLNLVPPHASGFIKSTVILIEAGLLTYGLSRLPTFGWQWLGSAVFLGCILHCIGDSLTPERVPWLWPKRSRYGVPIIAHTGNFTETKIITPIMLVALILLLWLELIQPATNWHLPF